MRFRKDLLVLVNGKEAARAIRSVKHTDTDTHTRKEPRL